MKNQIAVIGVTILMAAFVIAGPGNLFGFSFPWAASSPSAQLSFETLPLGGMVSLNFDDGYQSVYQSAWPILRASGLPNTHYLITHYLDHPGYLSTDEVLVMEKGGAEIGAHSRTHPHLASLDRDELFWQIKGSRKDLLGLGVKVVNSFAYPYGNYDEEVVAVVKESGFNNARAFSRGLNDIKSNRFLLERWGVDTRHNWTEVKDKIDEAIKDKKWLILVFHRIDEDGNPISVRHELLQQIIDYLKQQKILVVSTSEGVRLLDVDDQFNSPKSN